MAKHTLHATIIGASGYTGVELVRLLHTHPQVTITQLIGDRHAGKPFASVYKHLYGYALPDVISMDNASWDSTDIVFCCLPHATSQAVIAELPSYVKVIDLSADFRLENTHIYEQWYGTAHRAPELQKQAVYGLSEWKHAAIRNARLVACPGCYPTAATLPLIPLLEHQCIDASHIVVDAKSGASGAGRSEKQPNLYCEINEGLTPYAIGQHRHIPEMEQTLSHASGTQATVQFSPHLVPMSRGILATTYVSLSDGQTVASLKACLEKAYRNANFVTILDETLPNTRMTYGTNHCVINVCPSRIPGQAVIVSAIDNLMKGASGQAVQNMNLMFDLAQSTGLEQLPLFP